MSRNPSNLSDTKDSRRSILKSAGLTGLMGVTGVTGLSLASRPTLALAEPVKLPEGLVEGTVTIPPYEIRYSDLDPASNINVEYYLTVDGSLEGTPRETLSLSISNRNGSVMTGSHSLTVPAGEVGLQIRLNHPSVSTDDVTASNNATTIGSAIPDSVIFDFESGDLRNFDTTSGLQSSTSNPFNGSYSGYSNTNNTTCATATVYEQSGFRPTQVEYYYNNSSNGMGIGFYDSNGNLVFGSGTRWPQQDYVYGLDTSGDFLLQDNILDRTEINGNGGGWVRHRFFIDWDNSSVDVEYVHDLTGSPVTTTQSGLPMNSTTDIREFKLHTYDNRGQNCYIDNVGFFK